MIPNQHYVPQFYLRNFSEDKININIFNLDRQKEICGAISTQCCKSHFYDDNEMVEKSFSKLEDKIAPILSKIIHDRCFLINNEEYGILLAFILWQSERTKKAGDDMIDLANIFFDNLKTDLIKTEEAKKQGITPEMVNSVEISRKYPSLVTSYYALSSAHLIFDLKIVLLINESNIEFITSDSPSIKFNSFFNGKTILHQIGYKNKGLQIFFPIAPNLMILLYDHNYYEINCKEDRTIRLQKNKDIRRLNGLQVLFGLNNLYFNNYDSKDLSRHYHDLKLQRDKHFISKSLGIKPHENGTAETILFTKEKATYDLMKLSFISINKQADNNVGIRCEAEIIEKHMEEIKKRLKRN